MDVKKINEISNEGNPVFLYCVDKLIGKEYSVFGIRGSINIVCGIECLFVKISEEKLIRNKEIQYIPIPCEDIKICLGDFFNFNKIIEAYCGNDEKDAYKRLCAHQTYVLP